MRSRVPLSSKNINDVFLITYHRLVTLLGYVDNDGDLTYRGIYDDVEDVHSEIKTNIVGTSTSIRNISSLNYRMKLIKGS